MAGASILVVECQPSRIEFRKRTGYLDQSATSLEEALAIIESAKKSDAPFLLVCWAMRPKFIMKFWVADLYLDQTSAHDPAHGYLHLGWTLEEWQDRQERDPNGTADAAS